MKKFTLAKIAPFVLVAAISQSAIAAVDGTVNFTGEITNELCSLAPVSQNLTVPLGKVSKTTLNKSGMKSTPAKFTIELVNCPATATGATITFSGPKESVDKSLLSVSSGKAVKSFAPGVAIEIGNNAGVRIALDSPVDYSVSEGNNSLQFQALYVALTDKVDVGRADAQATFSITYK